MIEFITGCMFCGKTEELLRRLRRESISGKKVILFKPKIDGRYSEEYVKTHDGMSFKCVNVESSDDLYGHDVDVIGIDEVQFLDEGVLKFCKKFGDKLIIISGLNMDFRGEPFKFKDSEKHVGDLMAISKVFHLSAICTFEDEGEICGREAVYSQRFVNGKPVSSDDKLILIGGKEQYEARCEKHYIVNKKD